MTTKFRVVTWITHDIQGKPDLGKYVYAESADEAKAKFKEEIMDKLYQAFPDLSEPCVEVALVEEYWNNEYYIKATMDWFKED